MAVTLPRCTATWVKHHFHLNNEMSQVLGCRCRFMLAGRKRYFIAVQGSACIWRSVLHGHHKDCQLPLLRLTIGVAGSIRSTVRETNLVRNFLIKVFWSRAGFARTALATSSISGACAVTTSTDPDFASSHKTCNIPMVCAYEMK